MDYAGIIIALCFVILIFKMAALHYIDKYCMGWYLSLYKRFSTTVLQNYYQSGLLFIRKKGVTDLTYNTNGICYAFAAIVIPALLESVGKLCLVVVFATAFLIYSPKVALLFLLLLTLFAIVHILFTGKGISRIGHKEMSAKKEVWKTVQDCFCGYTEIEIYRVFTSFKQHFVKGIDAIISCQFRLKLKSEIPACLMEITMLFLLAAIFFLSRTMEELIMLLGAVSIGAFKILPSVRQVISGWNTLQNHTSTTDIVYEALRLCPKSPDMGVNVPFEEKLSFKDVSFSYDKQNGVLEHVSFTVKKGECVGIQGMSGIGKTTLLNVLLGFIKPDKGQVLVDSVRLEQANLQTWHRQVGYVPQEVFIMDGSIGENVALGIPASEINRQKLEEVIRTVQLSEWIQTLPFGMNTRIGEDGCLVSCGQKQRIGIARALYKEARLLILDEATSALDETTESNILDIVYGLMEQEPERTLIMVSHKRSAIGQCDRIINL